MSEDTKKARKVRDSYKFSAEQFVSAWQSSDSVDNVAKALTTIAGKPVPRGIVLARASMYKKRGVSLKSLAAKRGRHLDVDKLNTLATA